MPITKRLKLDDGSTLVYGKITDDTLDLEGQIVDGLSAAKSLDAWFEEYANIRQQHSPLLAPAGIGVALEHLDDGPYLTAKIVEPGAVKLVDAKVYKGFSIGIADGHLDTSAAARKRAPNGVLYASLVNEVSLVDYPANPHTKFLWARKRLDQPMEWVNAMESDVDVDPLETESFVVALKGLMSDGEIVHTCSTDADAAGLIRDDLYPADEYEARGNVVVVKSLAQKRDFDRGVGEHGTDRDKLPTSAFADPKNRKFPIVSEGDVSDAWGLAGHAANPDKVRRRIISMAEAKGFPIPQAAKDWQAERKGATKMAKVKIPEGQMQCPDCKGTKTMKGGVDDADDVECGKCKGMGHIAMTKALDTETGKGAIPKVDEDVTEALDDADSELHQAKDAQAKDNEHHESGDDADDDDGTAAKLLEGEQVGDAGTKTPDMIKPKKVKKTKASKAMTSDGETGDTKTRTEPDEKGADAGESDADDAKGMTGTVGGKGKKAMKAKKKKTQMPPARDPYFGDTKEEYKEQTTPKKKKGKKGMTKAGADNFGDSKAEPFGKKPAKEGKVKVTKGMNARWTKRMSRKPSAEIRNLHALLCPAYSNKQVAHLASKSLAEVLDPAVITSELARLARGKANTSDIGQAYSALVASEHVAEMSPANFMDLRKAAHKAFTDAYPDLKVGGPDLTDPEDFNRAFLTGATKETASTMEHPDNFPTPKPLAAGQFDRGPLTNNETRPTLSGGTPAKQTAGMKARTFYTTASGEAHADWAGQVHDMLVSQYPSVCAIAGPGAMARESEGHMNSHPENYTPGTPPAGLDGNASGMLRSVKDTVSATKGSGLPGALGDGRAVQALVDELVAREMKPVRKQVKSLTRQLRQMGNAPDRSQAASRIALFRTEPKTKADSQAVSRAKMLATQIRERQEFGENATVEQEELRSMTTPKEYVALLAAVDE